MKVLSLLSLFVATSAFAATPEWKVVAETSDCAEKIQILAKEGEKFVYAQKGAEKTKLAALGADTYKKDSPKAVAFTSTANDSGETISFTNPGMVEANPPKIQIANSNKGIAAQKCNVTVK